MISKACAALLRGASRGDADAMARLAHRYSHGDGVPKDLEQALNWALASADAGTSSRAMTKARRVENRALTVFMGAPMVVKLIG